jgi:hypothetical protein
MGVRFPVRWVDLGEDQGEMSFEPEAGGRTEIRIHERFKDTSWAWQVLYHEMVHASFAVSGLTEIFGVGVEESVVTATEGAWQGLVALSDHEMRAASKRVASRGSKGRGTKRSPTRRRGR